MRLRNSKGRFYSAANRDLMRAVIRVRQWMIAGQKIATAEELLAELDRVAARHPRLSRRAECVRAALVDNLMDSIISIPTEVLA